MKRRKVETYEYVLTKEEISMVMDICAMCVNRDIHSLGNHKGYYDGIKINANLSHKLSQSLHNKY